MHLQGRSLAGRAHLESDHLLFRGEERLRIPFREWTAVKAADGVLELDFAGGPARFDLGIAAEKWATKILHPPSRMDKLGIRQGAAVALVGGFDPDFIEELGARGAVVTAANETPAMVCFAAQKVSDLKRIAKVGLPLKGAPRVVYPKGVAPIREIEVIQAGRAAGLKDVKVASFSTTQTALKFAR